MESLIAFAEMDEDDKAELTKEQRATVRDEMKHVDWSDLHRKRVPEFSIL